MFTLIFLDFMLWCFFCTIFIGYEKGWFAFWGTVLAGVAAYFLGYNVPVWAWNNPMLVAQGFIAYGVIGTLWGSFKFVMKLNKAKKLYIKDKQKWLAVAPDFYKQDHRFYAPVRDEKTWIKHCKESYDYHTKYAPTVNENKENIFFWSFWWPFSMLSFFLSDFITEIFEFVWKFVKGFLEGIRKGVLGEAAKDLDDTP